jgi:hypothetical protein
VENPDDVINQNFWKCNFGSPIDRMDEDKNVLMNPEMWEESIMIGWHAPLDSSVENRAQKRIINLQLSQILEVSL